MVARSLSKSQRYHVNTETSRLKKKKSDKGEMFLCIEYKSKRLVTELAQRQ